MVRPKFALGANVKAAGLFCAAPDPYARPLPKTAIRLPGTPGATGRPGERCYVPPPRGRHSRTRARAVLQQRYALPRKRHYHIRSPDTTKIGRCQRAVNVGAGPAARRMVA